MKRLLIITIAVLQSSFLLGQGSAVIADSAFLNYLLIELPQVVNTNGQLILPEAAKVKTINCQNYKIRNLKGIENFAGLIYLNANNNEIKSLPDLSNLISLQFLYLNKNNIDVFPDISNLQALKLLDISYNDLKSISVIKNKALSELYLENNFLTQLGGISSLEMLTILDISSNDIDSLPNMDALKELKQFNCSYNNIPSLDPITSLTKLITIAANGNEITTIPDLSKITLLENLLMERNQISQLGNLLQLKNLKEVRLDNNYFTFEDFIQLSNYPNYKAVFEFEDQRNFKGVDLSGFEGEDISIRSYIDAELPEVIYDWYFNDRLVKTTFNDSLTITNLSSANNGRYHCRVRHPNFSNVFLRTNYLFLTVKSCDAIPHFTPIITTPNCLRGGEVKIDTTIVPSSKFDFLLENGNNGQIDSHTNGNFTGLVAGNYVLTVSSKDCKNQNSRPIQLLGEECKEVFITPNGDNDHDDLYFSTSEKIMIYDKSGKLINELQGPVYWNGLAINGSKVTPGYYIAEIKNTHEFTMISVFY